MEENVSYGLLVLLETLSPAERAVYVLRSVLDCPYREIASMLEKTESACRKLYSRAQEKLKGLDVQAKAHPVQAKNLVEQLMQAIVREDADALLSLLTQDAVLVSDGGGKVKAALRPIRSAQHVAAFLLGVSRKWPEERKVQFCSMNGQTGVVIRESGSTIINIVLAPGMERIQTIYILRNPEKLNHLS
jgi:RNA polymerase sigma-70 factor (ECF subfamily)